MWATQLLGMTRYEFEMHWRRRALIVATLSLIGLHLLIVLVLKDSLEELVQQLGGAANRNIVPFIWISIYMTIVALFGPIMTDAIPIDCHYGTYELLESLPLKRHMYLLGKLGGMILAVLVSLLIGLVVIGGGVWLILGEYNIPEYLRMWFIGALPIAILNPALSVLLAAGQPTRRRAAAIGGVFAIVSFFAFTSSVNTTLSGAGVNLLDSLSPGRPAILRYFMPVTSGSGTVLSLSSSVPSDVLLTIVMGVVELAVVGVLVWGWLRWRESRV